ncbi:LysR family transcriptional regulator, partial [Mesorhizobium sp. M7A.F.Ca.CA.001.14.1.1]|uniref:LysR family transcriptional regulator n=1 Tax=Mesorhizobium sp. M7A.F.Ca.CA.001.14.1.1 TaxID=2496706 RepID=UPI000FD5734D
MRFDLVDLRLFLLVAERGSITHGAELAGLALASASARIKGMEERLGAPAAARRGVGPTAA